MARGKFAANGLLGQLLVSDGPQGNVNKHNATLMKCHQYLRGSKCELCVSVTCRESAYVITSQGLTHRHLLIGWTN